MKALIKIFCGVLVVAVFAQALPADQRPLNSAKLGRVELEKDIEEFPEEGFPSFFNGMFERMRQQMMYLMDQIPRIGFATPGGSTTNTVTEMIDGHKVVINETVYSNGDGDVASAVFKIRVVEISPVNPEESSEVSSLPEGPKGSAESLEQSHENEIPKSQKTLHQQKRKVNSKELLDNDMTFNNFNDIETFDYPSNNIETFDEPDNIEPFENDGEIFEDDNEIDERPIKDLSNDILINTIAEKQGKPLNPDAEFISVDDTFRDLSRDTYINEIAEKSNQPLNPDAEIFDRVAPYSQPIYDLSRDTYVNEIAHGRIPLNPDAEILDFHPKNRYYYKTDNS